MLKQQKTSKHLSVVIDQDFGIHTTGQHLTGKVRIDVHKSEGLEISQISVNLVCQASVRIKRLDQVERKRARNVNNAMKLFDKEQRLLTQPEILGKGEQEIPFEFELPELPPTSSYRGKKGTRGSIKHLILVTVFGSKRKSSKPIMQGMSYFTFVPSSVTDNNAIPQELTFLVDSAAKRGGKIVQSLDATVNGIDTLQRHVRLPVVGLGVRSVSSLLKIAAAAGRSGIKSAPMLYGNLRLPSKYLRQDAPTDFVLELKAVEGANTMLIRSVSVNAQVLQVLKVDQYLHEAVIDTIPLFHQAVVKTGEDMSISGLLNFGTSVLPTFNTPLYSHVHKLEVIIEMSSVTGKKASTPLEIIELVPAKILSFIVQSTSQDPPRYTQGDHSRFMAYTNTGTNSKQDDDDEDDESFVEPYVPDINARSDSDSDHDDESRSEARDEKSSYIPSGYPVDVKEAPPPSYS